MTPEERELRRALDARSGTPSPEFRARLSAALAEDKPASNLMPALAAVAAAILVFASVGVLLLARQSRNLPSPGTATPTPLTSVSGVLTRPPVPVALPDSAQVSAPSGNVAWVLVAYKYLYRSTDRGLTWEQRPMLPASSGGYWPEEIAFVSDQEGFLTSAGSSVAQADPCGIILANLWHTTNAGTTWQLLGTGGLPDRGCKEHVAFVDSNRGFIDVWNQNRAPVIYRTTNGGRTWAASQPLPDPPGFTTGAGHALQVGRATEFGSTLLVTAISDQAQYVFGSSDGGATWVYLASSPQRDGAVAIVTSSQWIQLIGPGQTLETTDAGASWHLYASDYSQAAPIAPEVVFADSQVGYATVRGGISRTVDGGLHWTELHTPGT